MECTSDTAGHYLLILLGSHCRVPEPAWLREGRAFNSSWAASPVIVPILQVTKFRHREVGELAQCHTAVNEMPQKPPGQDRPRQGKLGILKKMGCLPPGQGL